ncbi:MAG: hypothetical protein ACREI2_00510 [Nitrospiraceae bacterium]
MTNRNQLLVLLVLGGIWAGLLVWRLVSTEEPARVPLVHVTGQSAHQTVARAKTGAHLRVDLDLLAASRTQREGTFTTPKNIFSLVRSDGPLTASSEAPLPVDMPLTPEEELSQQATAAELAQFRYLGYFYLGSLRQEGREIALLVKNDDLHVVRAGEIIQQRVLVKTITPTAVTLQETHSRVEQTVPLAEGES